MKYPYGKRTCAFLHTLYFNIFLPMLIFFINCTPIPDDISNQNTTSTDNISTAASASSAGHPSSANQTVFVGDICGQNMFWDPTLNTCKPKPNAGKSGVLDATNNNASNTNATIAKPGKKKKPFHSEEEVTDPPHHHETETNKPHVNETKQIRVDTNSDEEDVIPVKTDPHCGLGYEWSADDMMCAKDEQ